MTATLDELEARVEALRRYLACAEADFYEAQGDVDGTAWKRLEATGQHELATKHWARSMARAHLRDGTTPPESSYRPDLILAVMDEIRKETP